MAISQGLSAHAVLRTLTTHASLYGTFVSGNRHRLAGGSNISIRSVFSQKQGRQESRARAPRAALQDIMEQISGRGV